MKHILIVALLLFLLASCSPAVIHGTPGDVAISETGPVIPVIGPGESIVVLSAASRLDDGKGHTGCVRRAIERENPNIRIMAAKEFRDSLFPWLERDGIAKVIVQLVQEPLIRNRIEEMGVRYILAVGEGQTTSSMGDTDWFNNGYVGKHGMMGSGIGWLGFMAWKRSSNLSAVVWDLKSGVRTGMVDVETSGINVVPAFMFPIPLIAPTETAVCRKLGQSLARYVTSGELPVEPEVVIPAEESSSE